jgi:hypothetical protein
MSITRYIEIDSTYRNRNKWPNPAEFEVVVAQSGRKDKMNADDPVSDSAPINNFYWKSNIFGKDPPPDAFIMTTVQDFSTVTDWTGAGDNKTLILIRSTATDNFQTIENYYTGAIAFNTNTSQVSRIVSYVYLGNDRAQITVEGFTGTVIGNVIRIIDPSDITTFQNDGYGLIFVPNGRTGSNAYPGYILYNSSTHTYGNILGYNAVTRLLKVDITGLTWNLGANQVFSIHKKPPISGDLNNSQGDRMVLSLPTSFTNEQNTYFNSYISLFQLSPRRIIRYETFTGKTPAVADTTTTIKFPNTASKINGYYNNAYIQIISGAYAGQVRKIINYTVTGIEPNLSLVASVDLPYASKILDNIDFTFRSVFLDSPLEEAGTDGSPFQIFPFSCDNHNPFVYTGSMQQEIVCYQIELLNIIIPNKILNCGLGSRIAYYPYIYVELSNISGSSSGMKNSIYSNNPNATSMVFRVPIYDVQNPTNSSFVKLDGDGMTQTLKFKPNDSIFFSVHLSNGELFKTLESETYAPLAPNPEIQISAAFSFKRV